MIKKLKIKILAIIILAQITIPQKAYAALECYDISGDKPPKLGAYILCVLPGIWTFLQVIFIAAGLILLMYNVFQYLLNRTNSKFLETFNQKIVFLAAMFLLTAGFGATIINIFLQIFGLGTINTYLDSISRVLLSWDR